MGLSLSLLSLSWVEVARRRVFGLKEVEASLVKSLSFKEKDLKMTLRSLSFTRRDAGPTVIVERSPSFKNWAPCEEIKPECIAPSSGKQSFCEKLTAFKMAPDAVVTGTENSYTSPEFCSPRTRSELDAAAVKLQKVYKSYRTRRNLADCAVVVEELWWKALDFASLKHSSISYFDVEKPQTAMSRWTRALTRVAKVGKGLSKDEKAQKLALQHWLEAIDPRHRYGHNLHLYYDVWFGSESTQPFFYWLDVGDGREVNLENCSRSKLQQECIEYLGPKERKVYEVIVEDGKLVYKHSEALVNTDDMSKWIFVLSTSRSFYVGQKRKGKFQHSSFLSGGATSAAGRLVVRGGVLEAIWPYSGHYLPTEENFKEFISFLQDNNVDLTNVKRGSVDDDECPSFKKAGPEPSEEAAALPGAGEIGARCTESPPEKSPVLAEGIEKDAEEAAAGFAFRRPLSFKWSTGHGPRIGCVREYPADLQCKALEHVNLSPRLIGSPAKNKVPIPSPRFSPKLRVSPRLACMGAPSPRLSLTLPSFKKIGA